MLPSHSCVIYSLQVRDQMRSAKDTLQKLVPAASAAAKAAATSQPAAATDVDACIMCINQPASVIFHPRSHRILCLPCAKLVMEHKQLSPVCRSHVSCIQKSPEFGSGTVESS